MRRSRLKLLRVAGAALIFTGLAVALIDFRGAMAPAVGHALASLQLVPSLLALAAGVTLGWIGLVMLGATLAVGRIYCSVVCPLGVFQDLVAHAAEWIRRRKSRYPHRPARTWVRQLFLWGAVGGTVAGGAGLTLSLLDPYSIFGRIVSSVFRPVAASANNALVGLVRPFGWDGFYRVDLPWAGAGVTAVSVIMLLLVAGLAAWRGRLYCNTVCPVGTVLGTIARRSALQLRLDPGACRKCGDCLRVCRAQCIDIRAGTIDASRCVACYNCLGACTEGGIGYHWTWRRAAPPSESSRVRGAKPEGAVPDQGRRAFVVTTVAALAAAAQAGRLRAAGEPAAAGKTPLNLSRAICPPGASSVDRFLDRCTACHLCISACPTHVLQPALLEYGLPGLLKPRLSYAAAFCNFDCRRCAEVCPDGALDLLPLAQKQVTRIGAAELDLEKCIVKTKGTDCAACSEHCPTKAVDTLPYGDNLRLPQVNRDLCIGCGACEFACPSQPQKAIMVTGQRRHDVAARRAEEKAADPRKGDPFPF